MSSARPSSSARSTRTSHPLSAWEVFRVPLVLGLLTGVGLVSALVGDGAWDVLSWVTILAPMAVVARAYSRRA